MPTIIRTATFIPGDERSRIVAELACPSCGYVDDEPAYRPTRDNRLRIFCDGCGAFITFTLSAEQAEALGAWRPSRTPRSHVEMPA